MADFSISGVNERRSHSMMASANRGNIDPNMFREPDYFVYLFTVGDCELKRENPPLVKRLTIPSRGDQRYVKVCEFPHPMQQIETDVNNGNSILYGHDAKKVAMSIINPANSTLDQDARLDPNVTLSEGNDYGRMGVFFSLNEVPTEAEIKAAETRKENYYRHLLQEAKVAETGGPQALFGDGKNNSGVITRNHHLAAEYFGVSNSWHIATTTRPVDCEVCGEVLQNPKAIIHVTSWGAQCVRNWDEAISRGFKKPEERPAKSQV